eukprot:6002606-Prymnesium_polylepis.1
MVVPVNGSGCPGPTDVQAQLYVTKLHSVDEKKETIGFEAYFRLWWNDHRLAARQDVGCAENRSHGDANGAHALGRALQALCKPRARALHHAHPAVPPTPAARARSWK